MNPLRVIKVYQHSNKVFVCADDTHFEIGNAYATETGVDVVANGEKIDRIPAWEVRSRKDLNAGCLIWMGMEHNKAFELVCESLYG